MTVNERLHHFFQESVYFTTPSTIVYSLNDVFPFFGQVFDRLRVEKLSAINKVHAIEANFDSPDLSISDHNKQLIWNEVDVGINNYSLAMVWLRGISFYTLENP